MKFPSSLLYSRPVSLSSLPSALSQHLLSLANNGPAKSSRYCPHGLAVSLVPTTSSIPSHPVSHLQSSLSRLERAVGSAPHVRFHPFSSPSLSIGTSFSIRFPPLPPSLQTSGFCPSPFVTLPPSFMRKGVPIA